jgi:hypothetical protein
MPEFDVDGARKAGYSDDEILGHLTSTRKFDVDGARKAGYSNDEIIAHLRTAAPKSAPKAEPSALTKAGGKFVETMGSLVEGARGFTKSLGRDIYGLTELAGPGGMAAHQLLKSTGIDEKFKQATENRTPMEKAGGYAETAAALLTPVGPEVGESKVVSRLGKTLEESAEKGYSQALNATTRGNKLRSAKVVPGLIERGVSALTLKGLGKKVASSLDKATEALESGYAGLPQDAAIPADGFASSLMTHAKKAFEVDGISVSPETDKGLELAKELGNRVLDKAVIDPTTGNKVIPVGQARKIRQIYDNIAAAAKRYDGKDLADYSSGAVHGMAADAIREMLNQVASGTTHIGELNKEYSFWRNADTVIQETLLRKQGQARPLGQKIMQGAGAAAGFVKGGPKGAALGYEATRALEAATTSVGWRTAGAGVKMKLANAMASGNEALTSAIANGIAKGATLGAIRHDPAQ